MKITFNNRGQTLIEALIALTIILTIMSVTTVAVITSLNNANFIKLQTQSNKIAQEGMEHIRDQIVNKNLFAGFPSNPNIFNSSGKCMGPDNVIQAGNAPSPITNPCPVLIDGKFSRVVRFTNAQCDSTNSSFANGVRVVVTVHWRDGKCSGTTYCHKQEITSCFTNPSKVSPSSGTNVGI